MLLEFRCKNHKSIKDEVLFSLLASKDTFNSEYLYGYKDLKILKSSVVYGANGSGKSNFIDAIFFMKSLVTNSINLQPGMGIPYTPHKLNGVGSESFYSVQFIKNGVRFAYGFSIEQMLVKEEYLYYFPNGRQAKIFDRTGMTYEEGSKFKGRFNSCKDVLKPNRLMISCAANFTNITEIEDAFRFFSEDLVIYTNANQENWMQYSLYQFNSNPEIKKYNTNFSDELLSVELKESELESNELENYKKKAEYYIRQHQDHLVIAKLKKNQPLTDTDVKALEEILWREIGTKKDYEEEFGTKPLGEFVREIVGLDMNAAKAAFSEYLINTSLDSRQIYFVNQIVEYIVHNGMMKDFSVLREAPFTDQGSIVDIFTDQTVWMGIKKVIDNINANAVA